MKQLLLLIFTFLTFSIYSQAPANDNCENGSVVTEGNDIAFTTIEATTDGPEHVEASCFSFGGDGVYNDVWYNYTATSDSYVEWSTCGFANFDTRLAVYNAGANCPMEDADLLACNDDGVECLNFTSYLFFEAIAGQTYLLRLGGYQEGEFGEGTFDLNAIPDPEFSAHSICADADERPVVTSEEADNGFGWTFGDNILAPMEQGSDTPFCVGQGEFYDVWYSFNNGANDSIEVRFETITEGSLFSLEIYENCDTLVTTAGDGGDLIINCFPSSSVASGSMWLFTFIEPADYLIRISTQVTNDIPGEFKFQLVGTDEAVSVQDLGEEVKISLFPNPANEVLNIQTPFDRSDVFVFDLNGRQIHSTSINSSIGYLDLSSLLPGLYVLELRSENQVVRKKFVIQ